MAEGNEPSLVSPTDRLRADRTAGSSPSMMHGPGARVSEPPAASARAWRGLPWAVEERGRGLWRKREGVGRRCRTGRASGSGRSWGTLGAGFFTLSQSERVPVLRHNAYAKPHGFTPTARSGGTARHGADPGADPAAASRPRQPGPPVLARHGLGPVAARGRAWRQDAAGRRARPHRLAAGDASSLLRHAGGPTRPMRYSRRTG